MFSKILFNLQDFVSFLVFRAFSLMQPSNHEVFFTLPSCGLNLKCGLDLINNILTN